MKNKKIVLLLVLTLILSATTAATAQTEVGYMNRLDFTKEVLKTFHIQLLETTQTAFKDVASADIPYVETAYQSRIISGYGDFFKPTTPVTREQALIILIKAMGQEGTARKITAEEMGKVLTSQDQQMVSAWAKPYVAYAVARGIAAPKEGKLNPQAQLTHEDAKSYLEKAKQYYDANLTREGLSAAAMLQKVNEKFTEFNTYKYRGVFDMETIAEVPGQGHQAMKMEMIQEGMFQKPMQVYVKTTAKVAGMEMPGGDQTAEVYMTDNAMYIRVPQEEKWAKMDINPIMQEIQKLTGNQDIGNAVMSKDQMAALGMYATYSSDVIKNGKTYYVISASIDKEAFKKMFNEIMEKVFSYVADAAAKEAGAQPQVDQEMIKKQMMEMVSMMEIEVDYQMFIDKETKLFEDMKIFQTIHMNMGEIKSHVTSAGNFKYYDFNGQVTFPEIQAEDIQQLNTMQ